MNNYFVKSPGVNDAEVSDRDKELIGRAWDFILNRFSEFITMDENSVLWLNYQGVNVPFYREELSRKDLCRAMLYNEMDPALHCNESVHDNDFWGRMYDVD